MTKIQFNPPIEVGDLNNRIQVDEMGLVAFSFNRQLEFESQGQAVLGIMLEHPATRWTHSVAYRDMQALALTNSILRGNFSVRSLDKMLIQKLLADGKIPTGQIVG